MRLGGELDPRAVAQVEDEVTREIDDAVAFAEASPLPEPEDALLHVFWEER